jgi:hypothetical protein
MVEART